MTWIDLGNPTPLCQPKVYIPYEWNKGAIEPLSVPDSFPKLTLVDVLESRRTIREFKKVSSTALSDLMWLTSREKLNSSSEFGFKLSKRPLPSSGAIHPIHILIANLELPHLMRYVPESHSLAEVIEHHSLEGIRQHINSVLPMQDGTIMLFAAEPGKTFAKYEYASSLIWRDMGVILGNLAICAEFLNLNFCPLGITGEPWVSSLDQNGSLVGVGVALLGSR